MRQFFPLALIIAGLLLMSSSLFPGLVFTLDHLATPTRILIDPSAVSIYLKTATSALGWFAATPLGEPFPTSITHFTVSYSRLGLKNVSVTVNGDDLRSGPIHYPGTVLPGRFGNAVIFGHSALPGVYPKNSPLVIFNPLLKAKIGDDVLINFDGVTYRYLVRKITEVEPNQVEVLFQDFSKKELTLITCTPLGTYWRRFVVRAELVN